MSAARSRRPTVSVYVSVPTSDILDDLTDQDLLDELASRDVLVARVSTTPEAAVLSETDWHDLCDDIRRAFRAGDATHLEVLLLRVPHALPPRMPLGQSRGASS